MNPSHGDKSLMNNEESAVRRRVKMRLCAATLTKVGENKVGQRKENRDHGEKVVKEGGMSISNGRERFPRR